MRITNNMMVKNVLYNISKNMNRLEKLQQQESTGKTTQLPSDDPVRASRSMRLSTYISKCEQLQKNVDDAISWMDSSSTALDSLDEAVQSIRDLVVKAANGTNTESDKASIKAEVDQLKDEIIDLGNTSYSGKSMFAGYDTTESPFKEATTNVGSFVTYKGKYLCLGGPVASSVSDSDYETFIKGNLDKTYGLPELEMGNFQSFTADSSTDSFDVTLDGVTKTITLSDGSYSDIDSTVTELQTQINSAFPSGSGDPDPIIKVSADNGKISFTALSGSSLKISSSSSNSLDLSKLGLTDGATSEKNEKQEIQYDVGSGNKMTVNVEGSDIFGQSTSGLLGTIQKIELALDGESSCKTATISGGTVTINNETLDLSNLLDDLDNNKERILTVAADLGARNNNAEDIQSNLEESNTNLTKLLSKSADADISEITVLVSEADNNYTASLSTSAKIIQKSLIDYLS